MNLKEIKKEAIEVLKYKNNWIKLTIMLIAYYLLCYLSKMFYKYDNKIGVLGIIVFAIFSIPFAYGVIVSFIKAYKKEEVHILGFITEGFSNFYKSWEIFFRKLVKLLPWILLVIVIQYVCLEYISTKIGNLIIEKNLSFGLASGLYRTYTTIISIVLTILKIMIYIKSLPYLATEYIIYENENITVKNALEESKKIIAENKDKWRKVTFLFIGINYGLYISLITIMYLIMNALIDTNIESFNSIYLIISVLNYIRMIFIIIVIQAFYVVMYKNKMKSNKTEEIADTSENKE